MGADMSVDRATGSAGPTLVGSCGIKRRFSISGEKPFKYESTRPSKNFAASSKGWWRCSCAVDELSDPGDGTVTDASEVGARAVPNQDETSIHARETEVRVAEAAKYPARIGKALVMRVDPPAK